MADPVWLPEVLRAAGLEVRVHQAHGSGESRCGGAYENGHGDFGDIWGMMFHHTGSYGETENGIAHHPELGLCSQCLVTREGVWIVCGVGIAYHAGIGSYPGVPTNDGNRVLIGVEVAHDGGGRPGLPHRSVWSDAQYESVVTGFAACLAHMGKPASRAIGHKEYAGAAQGKWDPGGIDLNIFRTDVARAIDGQPPQKGEGTVWSEIFKNFKKQDVSYGTAIYYIDQLVNAIADQVTRGWKQLGSNASGEPMTLVDSQAAQNATLARIEKRLDAIESKLGGEVK